MNYLQSKTHFCNHKNLTNASTQTVIGAELIGSDRCSALGMTARGTTPVLGLCRLLVEAGLDPITPLEAWRGSTLCLRVRRIGEAAQLELSPRGAGFVRGRPPVAQTARSLPRRPAAHWSRPMKPLDSLPARQPRPRGGGRRSRDKGNRTERAIVAFLQNSGFAAERVPLSGSAGGKYVGDVTIPLPGRDMCAEVKVRAHGFGQLYAWLDSREILIVRQDRREPLVIQPLRLAAEIAGRAEGCS